MNKIQALFSTPKKTVITIISAVAIVAVLCVFSVFASGAIAQIQSIGKTAAEYKALADAGIKEDDAVFSTTEFKRENGQYVYEVEFTSGSCEYEYVIGAKNGAVISANVEDISRTYQVSAETQAQADGTESSVMQDSGEAQSTQSDGQAEYIKLSAAKKKALSDADVKSSAATFTKAKLDYDDGVAVYDIEFYTSSYEYDYEINAKSGAIIEKNTESLTRKKNKTNTVSKSSESTATASQSSSGYIGISSAKKKALSDAGVKSSAATFTKAKLDYDDGVAVYDIEFYTSSYEYDYEINAKNGKIVDKSAEKIKSSGSGSGSKSKSYIGVDKAKLIALEHAGLAASSNVNFKKAKLEKDDGITAYEIEFICSGIEYEYTIEAYTGKILEYDSEYDD